MEPILSKVRGGALNMRKSPSTSASVVVQIPNTKDLVVWSDNGFTSGWFHADYNGNSGYVMYRYVAVTKDGGSCKVTTSSGSLNIRKTPSSSADVIYTAANGSTLRLLDSTSVSGWYLVSNGNGTGWAMSQYLSNIVQPSGSTIQYDASGTTNQSTPLGYCASYESVIGTIPSGTSLSLLTLTNNGNTWYKTSYGGQTGFVDGNFIS